MVDMVFDAFIRPLSMTFLGDELPANRPQDVPNLALQHLGEISGDRESTFDTLKRRCKEITDEANEPFVVPLHPELMRHVVKPLQEAKHCYVLGMPVACIAQAGLVGEMVALWRYKMMEPTWDGKPFDEEFQKLMWGWTFERLGQDRRVEVLKALDGMSDEVRKCFNDLRGIRRAFMHYMVDETRNADAEARTAFKCAVKLVKETLGVTFDKGKVLLPPHVVKFVGSIMRPAPQPPAPPAAP